MKGFFSSSRGDLANFSRCSCQIAGDFKRNYCNMYVVFLTPIDVMKGSDLYAKSWDLLMKYLWEYLSENRLETCDFLGKKI